MQWRLALYIIAIILLTMVYWQWPLQKIAQASGLEFVYKIDLKEKTFTLLNKIKNSNTNAKATFHSARVLGVDKQNATVFEVSTVDLQQGTIRQLQIPNDSVARKSKEWAGEKNVVLPKGEGYITFSENAPYFLWYPKIGRQVFLFDARGDFLWVKNESRYLQSFHDGRYVFALAGDHSRLLFTNADMSTLLDAEGMNLIAYQLASIHEDADKMPFHACGGFLNGDVLFSDLKNKKNFRVSHNKILKSVACNLEQGVYYAQVNVVSSANDLIGKDYLLGGKIKNTDQQNKSQSNEKEIKATIVDDFTPVALLSNKPFSAPMAVNQNNVVLVLEGDNDSSVFLGLYQKGSILFQGNISSFFEKKQIDDFRVLAYKEYFIIYNSQQYMLADQQGVFFISPLPEKEKVTAENTLPNAIEKIFIKDNFIVIQNNRQLTLARFLL